MVGDQSITMAMLGAECVDRFGEEILESEIARRLLTQAIKKAGVEVTQNDINAEAAEAAVRFGFIQSDGSADMDKWVEAITQDGMSAQTYVDESVWPTAALKKLVAESIEITQEDMDRGYVNAYGPRAEVLAIVLSDQRSAQKVWKAARDGATEESFGSLAERYSVEPISASNRGKIPPIPKFGGQPSVEKEAFRLKPGELSGIIVTGGQYIILRCQGFTEPIVTDRESVREELIRDLKEKKFRQAMVKRMKELQKSAEIENFLAQAK